MERDESEGGPRQVRSEPVQPAKLAPSGEKSPWGHHDKLAHVFLVSLVLSSMDNEASWYLTLEWNGYVVPNYCTLYTLLS
jgi:hypothetical protein